MLHDVNWRGNSLAAGIGPYWLHPRPLSFPRPVDTFSEASHHLLTVRMTALIIQPVLTDENGRIGGLTVRNRAENRRESVHLGVPMLNIAWDAIESQDTSIGDHLCCPSGSPAIL